MSNKRLLKVWHRSRKRLLKRLHQLQTESVYTSAKQARRSINLLIAFSIITPVLILLFLFTSFGQQLLSVDQLLADYTNPDRFFLEFMAAVINGSVFRIFALIITPLSFFNAIVLLILKDRIVEAAKRREHFLGEPDPEKENEVTEWRLESKLKKKARKELSPLIRLGILIAIMWFLWRFSTGVVSGFMRSHYDPLPPRIIRYPIFFTLAIISGWVAARITKPKETDDIWTAALIAIIDSSWRMHRTVQQNPDITLSLKYIILFGLTGFVGIVCGGYLWERIHQ